MQLVPDTGGRRTCTEVHPTGLCSGQHGAGPRTAGAMLAQPPSPHRHGQWLLPVESKQTLAKYCSLVNVHRHWIKQASLSPALSPSMRAVLGTTLPVLLQTTGLKSDPETGPGHPTSNHQPMHTAHMCVLLALLHLLCLTRTYVHGACPAAPLLYDPSPHRP